MKTAAHPHEKPHHPHWPLSLLLFGFVFALGMTAPRSPWPWISVKTGARILADGAVPRTDPFSYGAAGAPWTTDSWLADVLLAKLDGAGGPALVRAAKSAVLGGAFSLLLPISHGHPVLAASVLAVGACAAWSGMAETPRAFDLLLFALFVRLLRPRRRFRWLDAAAAAALTALWSNLHGAGAAFALGFAALKTFKASMRAAAGERLGYWALLFVCLIVFAWNPHGYGVFGQVVSELAGGRIPLLSLYGLLLLAGLASCYFTLQQEFLLTMSATAVLALSLALPGLRPLACLAACPLIVLALGHWVRPRADTPARTWRWAGFAAALFLIQIAGGGSSRGSGYGAPALARAAEFINSTGLKGRMFNEPQLGVELIGLTDRPVFSDLRRGLYPAAFALDARDWQRVFPQLDSIYRFDYAVVRRRPGGAGPLETDKAWVLAYSDESVLIFVKRAGLNSWLLPHLRRPRSTSPSSPDILRP